MASPSKGPRKSLLDHSRQQLQEVLEKMGEAPYRAGQVMQWCYHRNVREFQQMTNLSKALRTALEAELETRLPPARLASQSSDGVVKWIVESSGGGTVESVLIPDLPRNTLCVSSQIGCSLDCKFCATGKQGFGGNLSTADIIGQVWHSSEYLSQDPEDRGELTNVVFMGMGEPLLNLDAVLSAASILMDDMAFGLSKRRVTISTAGVVPGILKMCGRTEASLAVSLHAPNDELRSELVPINRKHPIKDLLRACREYLATLGDRRVLTFEYTLIEDVNDSLALARDLARLVADLRCKINLIPFNSFPGTSFKRPSAGAILDFQNELRARGLMATCRATRGDEISAACGQLVGRFSDRTRRRERYLASTFGRAGTSLAQVIGNASAEPAQ